MHFPKAHEIEIEITKIIGCNYKVNLRAWGDLTSCFRNDDASLGQTGFQSTPRMAALTSEPRPCPGGRGGAEYLGRGSAMGRDREIDARESESQQPQTAMAWRPPFKDQIHCLDPVLAFQLPQASLVVSGRAATIQNKIKFNSLRRGKKKRNTTKVHSISPKGRVWEPTAGTSQQGSTLRGAVSFPLPALCKPLACSLAGSSSP